ncbi:MAG TPA: glycosyltransferase family 1 protein [Planctomycetota bacterium]|nr:glycosyltransferase family 1 protein [Planctomycetota bacterium]
MDILLDGAVFEMPLTGVGKAALLTYTHALEKRPALSVSILHRKTLQCAIPQTMSSRQRGTVLPSKWWRRFVLPWSVRRARPRAVHFPWNGNIPTLPARVKVITTLHDVLPLTIPNFFKTSEDERQYRERVQSDVERSDLLLTDSEFSKREILKHFNPKTEPYVLYLAATLHGSPTRQRGEAAVPFLLYVGGYDPRKGLDTLLRIHTALWKEKKTSAKLVLTGSQNYYSADFKALVAEALASGAAEERGYVSDDELAQLLSSALALVYPSRFEGFGLPPLEAMALGCPVITTQETSLPEVCGDAALYVRPENTEEFASALTRICSDADLRHELSAKGLAQAQKFSWSRTAEQFLAQYDKLIR